MGLEISSAVLARLLAEARAAPGVEVCGLLFGAGGRIDAAEACANVAAAPARTFEIDPAALFAAHRRARGGGPAVIGHYHSHPSGRAEPSATDAANAMGDGAVWLILAREQARAWRTVRAGAFEAVALAVREA
ncbi:M67 family metallopeptidase [Sphingomonas sp. PB4P5]|uniref:M67 family metallopeptidase n=1 Tax=Parasphingomonas puruogangriensis TaxID=3096155 RepID=UPI002FCB1AC9